MNCKTLLIKAGMICILLFITYGIRAQEIEELELRSDAILLPRTIGSLVESPMKGMLIYNIDSNTLYTYDGSSWEEVGGGFTRSGNIIYQYNSDFTDVFLFGTEHLPEDASGDPSIRTGSKEDKRKQSPVSRFFFFDEESGAFRGGELEDSGAWGPSALGRSSFAYGRNTEASGDFSISIGESTVANANSGTVVGAFNDPIVVKGYDQPNKPLFIVGSGRSNSNRSNALVVSQGGEVAFENYKFPREDGDGGQILKTNGNGQLIWTDVNTTFQCPADYEAVTNFCIEEDPNIAGEQTLETAIETCASEGGQVPTYQQFYLAVDAAVLNTTSGANRRHWMEDLVYDSGVKGTTALEKTVASQSISVTSQETKSKYYFRCVINK